MMKIHSLKCYKRTGRDARYTRQHANTKGNIMNPLNTAWYTLGDNTYSVLEEVVKATPVGREEPTNQCAHTNMHEVIDWNATWVFVEQVAASIADSLGDAQAYAEEAVSDIDEVKGNSPENADIDWTTTTDGVRITVSFGENYDADNAETNLHESIGSIENAQGELEQIIDLSQEDMQPDFTGGVCSDCMMAFTPEQYNEIVGSDLIKLNEDDSLTRDTSARKVVAQQIVDALEQAAR